MDGLKSGAFAMQALAHYCSMASTRDNAASSHWTESNRSFAFQHGDVARLPVIGSRIPREGRFGFLRPFLHWALQSPARRLGSNFKDFPELMRLGGELARRRGDIVDEQIIRHVLTLSLLREKAAHALTNGYVAVIGDGNGVMASLLLLANPETKVLVINLTRSLMIDLIFVRQCAPDVEPVLVETVEEADEAIRQGNRLVALQAHHYEVAAEFPVSLGVNVASMQEMDYSAINGYFDVLRRNRSSGTLFYCANREEKILPDGSVIRFAEYPWDGGDRVAFDEQVPWMRFVYHTRPPFYRPYDGPIRHRLALLKKR